MNCPVCEAEMKVYHTDVTENPGTGDRYDRSIFKCGYDDSWVTVETPHHEKAASVEKRGGGDQGVDADGVDDE